MPALQDPTVPEAQARDLLLLRAFEEADRGGTLLAQHERERATADAVVADAEDPHGLELATRRAATLLPRLHERVRGLHAVGAVAGADLAAAWLVPLALILGLASNALGRERVLEVLAPPLLVVIVWNLAVYLLLAIAAWRRWRRREAREGLAARIADLGLGRRLRAGLARTTPPAGAPVVTAAVSEFGERWMARTRPLIVARAARAMHLAAAAMVLGVVAGMYLRGIGFEYRVQWSSTFLSAAAVDRVGDLLRFLTRIDLPAAESLRSPATGPAAPWIHAWAIAACLFVVLPRLGLWFTTTLRIRRLAAAVPIDVDAPYWRRLRASAMGVGERVQVLSLAGELPARSSERLRGLLHDLCGARSELAPVVELGYGAEASEVQLVDGDQCLVPVFDLAQPPELEVQGRLVLELRQRLEAHGEGGRMLVVIDGSSFAARQSGDVGRERLRERRGAWDRALADAGVTLVHLELGRPIDESELARAAEALWAAGSAP